MSPEQARGDSHQADRRSDVYSLGVMLFELLTGEQPFRGNLRMVTQQVLHEDPPIPRKLNPTVPRDLEAICLRCLEKDPNHRYDSARTLAADLERFLRGEPTLARPITRPRRLWRWCRRRPVVAGLAAALAACLVILVAASMTYSLHARSMVRDSRWQAYLADMHVAMKAWEVGDVPRVVRILDRHRPAPKEEDLRRFEWYYLWRLCQPSLSAPTLKNSYGVMAMAVSSDGSTLMVGTQGNSNEVLNCWDTGQERQRLPDHNHWVTSVAISPDDRELLVTRSEDGELRIWDLETGALRRKIPLTGYAGSPAVFSRDGRWLACADANHVIQIRDTTTWQIVKTLVGHNYTVKGLDFSPDGRTLASSSDDASVRLWELATGEERCSLLGHEVGDTVGGVTTFGDLMELKAGNGTFYDGDAGDPRNFWGDYTATVVDPSDPYSFWTFQEFTQAKNQWGLQVTQILLPGAASRPDVIAVGPAVGYLVRDNAMEGVVDGHGEPSGVIRVGVALAALLVSGIRRSKPRFGGDRHERCDG